MPSEAVFRRHFCGFPIRFFKLKTCRPLSGNRPDAAPFQAVIV
ncbi:hypothetical protein [Neisseria lactamica]|nr:hypothetical protein [Neisseria lactamica]